ncbi:MAG: hypothetical protein GF317_12075 [Candidatus Lokiarchaeota archaeon]|nr:hypothetical protein [Candidatus Lokiarchaeota archaeon]MBD3200381.1 hypothetical protein [Candidatus Lokiarchaeota archaeon]
MQFDKDLLKKIDSELLLFSITFLFFFQIVGDLISSIYILDLLNLELDEKVLGVLFLLSPFFLVIFRKKIPNIFPEIMALILIIMRILTPLVNTATKIIVAGIGAACFLLFLSSYFSRRSDGKLSVKLGIGLGFAVLLSIMFRSLNATIDISLYGAFQTIGWVLGVLAIFSIFIQLKTEKAETSSSSEESTPTEKESSSRKPKKVRGVILLSAALTNIIILSYFALTSPTVISRWTGGSYIGISLSIVGMIIFSILLLALKPEILNKLNRRIILIWNFIFVAALVLTISVHTFPFPSTPSSEAVTIIFPLAWYFYLPLGLMIALLPIIFIDFALISKEILNQKPTPIKLGISFGLSGFFFILVSFILIFTNVWGYVEPVSTIFRNLFWLPFLLVGILIASPTILVRRHSFDLKSVITTKTSKIILIGLIALILFGTITPILGFELGPMTTPNEPATLKIMTYNIQQGVDANGNVAYDKQIEVIKSLGPDIIGLQESDTARISGGNSDVVRYFASHLPGYYYSFYGPRTVTGTYGAAVLSKYPIKNTQTFFTYSNVDEIGSTQVVITIGTSDFNVFINHPAGNSDAKLAHMTELMTRVNASNNVISLGDFNTREDTLYYNLSVQTLVDTWRVEHPTTEMADRIDYIFVSPSFTIVDAEVIAESQSYSDHPAFWAEIDDW